MKLCTYPIIIIYLNITKKILLWKLYVTTVPGFRTMHLLLALLKLYVTTAPGFRTMHLLALLKLYVTTAPGF